MLLLLHKSAFLQGKKTVRPRFILTEQAAFPYRFVFFFFLWEAITPEFVPVFLSIQEDGWEHGLGARAALMGPRGQS